MVSPLTRRLIQQLHNVIWHDIVFKRPLYRFKQACGVENLTPALPRVSKLKSTSMAKLTMSCTWLWSTSKRINTRHKTAAAPVRVSTFIKAKARPPGPCAAAAQVSTYWRTWLILWIGNGTTVQIYAMWRFEFITCVLYIRSRLVIKLNSTKLSRVTNLVHPSASP